jgi:thiol:disulfide interchange protein DsbD
MNAQQGIIEPVSWESKVEKISETEYNIVLKGFIDKGWHVFSQFTSDEGSLPSVLTFENLKGSFELIGDAKESETKKVFSDIFKIEETYFLNEVQFTQRIKLLSEDVNQINVHLEYQVCKDVCINKEKFFLISLDGSVVKTKKIIVDERSKELSKKLILVI